MNTNYHLYSENNISSCKYCKDKYEIHKEEDGQIEDYHLIKEIKNENDSKKRVYDATIFDFYNGSNLRMKEGFFLSQKNAYEVIIDDENIEETEKLSEISDISEDQNTHKKSKNISEIFKNANISEIFKNTNISDIFEPIILPEKNINISNKKSKYYF
jgi:hypothetical protein